MMNDRPPIESGRFFLGSIAYDGGGTMTFFSGLEFSRFSLEVPFVRRKKRFYSLYSLSNFLKREKPPRYLEIFSCNNF